MNSSAKILFERRISSTLGDSIYQVAVVWHVFYLMNSIFYTRLATVFTIVPKSLTFLAASLVFARIKYADQSRDKSKFNFRRYKHDLFSGFKYMFTANILLISLPFLMSNLTSGITQSVLPAFAEEKISDESYLWVNRGGTY